MATTHRFAGGAWAVDTAQCPGRFAGRGPAPRGTQSAPRWTDTRYHAREARTLRWTEPRTWDPLGHRHPHVRPRTASAAPNLARGTSVPHRDTWFAPQRREHLHPRAPRTHTSRGPHLCAGRRCDARRPTYPVVLVPCPPSSASSSPCTTRKTSCPCSAPRLRPVADGLGTTYEVVAVDDGSDDPSPVVLQRMLRDWPQLRIVRLRANAGHQAAISAGLASGPRRLRRHPRRRPAGPARGDPRDARPGARRSGADVVYGVRSDRSSDSAFKRLSAQRLLPAHPHPVRHPRPGRRRRLPPDVTGHRQRDQRPARAPPRAAVRRAGARLPVDLGDLPPRRAGGRQVQVPAVQDDPAVARQRHRLLHRSPARRHLAGAARWARARSGCSPTPWSRAPSATPCPVGRRPWSPSPGWAPCSCSASGILGEYVGRMYAQLQARPTYFVAYDSLTGPVTPADEPHQQSHPGHSLHRQVALDRHDRAQAEVDHRVHGRRGRTRWTSGGAAPPPAAAGRSTTSSTRARSRPAPAPPRSVSRV